MLKLTLVWSSISTQDTFGNESWLCHCSIWRKLIFQILPCLVNMLGTSACLHFTIVFMKPLSLSIFFHYGRPIYLWKDRMWAGCCCLCCWLCIVTDFFFVFFVCILTIQLLHALSLLMPFISCLLCVVFVCESCCFFRVSDLLFAHVKNYRAKLIKNYIAKSILVLCWLALVLVSWVAWTLRVSLALESF